MKLGSPVLMLRPFLGSKERAWAWAQAWKTGSLYLLSARLRFGFCGISFFLKKCKNLFELFLGRFSWKPRRFFICSYSLQSKKVLNPSRLSHWVFLESALICLCSVFLWPLECTKRTHSCYSTLDACQLLLRNSIQVVTRILLGGAL